MTEVPEDAAGGADDGKTPEGVDEDAIDLSALDEPGGFDRELAKMSVETEGGADDAGVLDAASGIDDPSGDFPDGAPDDFDDLARVRELRKGKASKLFGGRSPIVSTLVIGIGGYLLASMFSDVRYWATEREVHDLGAVSEIYEDGTFSGNFHNRQVQLQGTPDVQHAAKLVEGEQEFGVLRLREGGGSVYAMFPTEAEGRYDEFSGSFTGRMRRMEKAPYFDKIRQFFDGEGIVNAYDVDLKGFAGMLDAGEIVFDVPGAGAHSVSKDDAIVLSFRQPEYNVQMGRSTWNSQAKAEAAVKGLGYPYISLDDKAKNVPGASLARTFRRFVVRPTDGKTEEQVLAALEAGEAIPTGGADPKVGAAVFPSTHTYVVKPSDVSRTGENVVFAYGTNTTAPGYVVEDGELVERALDGGALAMPSADLAAVRVDHPISVDPEGYLIEVGSTYRDERLTAFLFLLVLGLMGTNVVSLVLRWRKRQAEA